MKLEPSTPEAGKEGSALPRASSECWSEKCERLRQSTLSHAMGRRSLWLEQDLYQHKQKARAFLFVAFVVFAAVGISGYIVELFNWQQSLDSISAELVPIPAGGYLLGSAGIPDAAPLHPVAVSAFHIMKFEVTQAQYEQIMHDNPSHFKGGDLPVESVTWDQCQQFIDRLNSKQTAYMYNLPTEAEWETAASAGADKIYSFGNTTADLVKYGWYGANSDRTTHPVGRLRANRFGVYDMYGNVAEWCLDGFSKYPAGFFVDTLVVPTAKQRVVRGGSWSSDSSGKNGAAPCASAARAALDPASAVDSVGFRLVAFDRSGPHVDKDSALEQIADEYKKRGMPDKAEIIYDMLPAAQTLSRASVDNFHVIEQQLLHAANLRKLGRSSESGKILSTLDFIALAADSATAGKSLHSIAQYHFQTGDHKQAKKLIEHMVAINIPPSDNAIASDYLWLAHSYLISSNIGQAEPILQQLSSTEASLSAANRKDVASLLQGIRNKRAASDWQDLISSSTAAFNNGDYPKAETLLQKAITDGRRLKDDDKLATALTNLAAVYHVQKRYALAEPLYNEAESILRSHGQKYAASLRKLLNNYADLLRNTGRSDKADQLVRPAPSYAQQPQANQATTDAPSDYGATP